jgi:hypothetical protein
MPRQKAAPPQSQSAPMSPPIQGVHAKSHELYMTRRQQDPTLPMAIVVQTQLFHDRQGQSASVAESNILESLGQSHLVGIPMHFRAINQPFIVCLDEAALQPILSGGSH